MATQTHARGDAESVQTGSPGGGGARLAFLVRALRHRNYALFFSGQSISLIGTWMTRIATSWLVYKLTGSSLMLGLVGFAGQIPTFILAPFSGVLIDRWDRHRVLVVTQVLAMIQSFLLAGLALLHIITIPQIIALSIFQGLINAFDMPARQAFVVEMVEDRADLGNAIALNSSMVNGARLLGPSIAGILIAAVGEGWCFFADGVSYVAVIASLLAMRFIVKEKAPRAATQNVFTQFRDGFTYAFGYQPIRSVLLLLALVSLVGMPYTVLMPVFATQVLKGGPSTLGFLTAGVGIGSLVGAVYLAGRRSILGLGRVIPAAAAIFGVGLIAFSLVRHIWLAIPILAFTGFGFMIGMPASNTLLQTIVSDEQRGRVMSFYTMAFMGTAPFGSLLAGALATHLGAPHTVILCGIGCIVGAALFYAQLPSFRRVARPRYQELGIVPMDPGAAPAAEADLRSPVG